MVSLDEEKASSHVKSGLGENYQHPDGLSTRSFTNQNFYNYENALIERSPALDISLVMLGYFTFGSALKHHV